MAFDVFVSYASKDKTVADAVCAKLESAGIRCWIAPRDIVPGRSYGEAIIEAIHAAKVMVLVFSSNANASGHIPKEVERAVSSGLAILPFRIEDVAPGKSLDYFIGSVHWLDAMTPPMEKHLDDLAATVHKLLPAMAGDQEVGGTQAAKVWQSAPGIAATRAPVAGVRAAGAAPSASSAKMIWIGVVAVIVLTAVVVGVKVLGGGSSQGGADTPNATNRPGDRGAISDGNPAGKAPASSSREGQPAALPNVKTGSDPIVGCYQWFNNAPVVIHADGTMVGGPFTGHWRLVSAARHAYTFTWPEATDTVTISPDQRSLNGGNQYGYPASGTRIAGSRGLVGTWRWSNGVPLTVYSDGGFSAAAFRGRWQAIDTSRGMYTLTWPNPVDSVTLSGGSRISGANQYGVAISGVRTEPCGEN
ncbi:MAG: toll/interleukin-1 receptor domain-containing protein [Candidatus Acidiferrum sp.]